MFTPIRWAARRFGNLWCVFALVVVGFGAILLNASSGIRHDASSSTPIFNGMDILPASTFGKFQFFTKNPSTAYQANPMLYSPEWSALDSLLTVRSRKGVIAFSMTNLRMMDFTLNYVAFARKNNMDMYLILALDQDSHIYMQDRGIPSLVANWGRTIWENEGKRCGGLKAKYTLEILKRGYDVIMNDVDIVYMDDVLPYLSKEHDISSSVDSFYPEAPPINAHSNLGFVYIRSTPRAIRFIQRWHDRLVFFDNDIWDQRLFFDMILEEGLWTYRDQSGTYNPGNTALVTEERIRVNYLDPSIFTHGGAYVTERTPQRAGVKPVEIHYGAHTCGPTNKRLRAREANLWVADPASYYSRKLVKFTSTATPKDFSWTGMVAPALKMAFALAKALDRSVIVPRLPCRLQGAYRKWIEEEEYMNVKKYSNGGLTEEVREEIEWCTFDHFVSLKKFVGKGWNDYYRESNVLEKEGMRKDHRQSIVRIALGGETAKPVIGIPIPQGQNGFTDVQLRQALLPYKDKFIIDFGVLKPELFLGFADNAENQKFNSDLDDMLTLTNAGRAHWVC